MSSLVYRICKLISQVLASVPVGTNLGLLHLLFALISGRFLSSRGAVFPALASLGLPDADVRRNEAALCYGRWQIQDLLDDWQIQDLLDDWQIQDLLDDWQRVVADEERFVPCVYEGIRPVACDLTAFFRPQLRGREGKSLRSKHYVSDAGKALPALVFGLCAAVGRVSEREAASVSEREAASVSEREAAMQTRLAMPRFILRREENQSEADLQKHLLTQATQGLAAEEALVVDAGFGLGSLLDVPVSRFVARVRSNQTARRSALPLYKGRGRRPTRGDLVRPLARTRAGQSIAATAPDETATWVEGRHQLRAEIWHDLVLPDAQSKTDAQAKTDAKTFRIVAIYDARYPERLLLASNLDVSAEAMWRLYRDRWAIEQLPLSAKPILGAERAFVFGNECCYRLPELALLAGTIVSYVAATSAPVASGFWDRAARPTCGRLRRVLSRVHSADLPALPGQLRKKNSVTSHLKTGVEAHRRHKAQQAPAQEQQRT
jgi:hypothetical protein